MLRLFSCRSLLCYGAAITVLLLLVVYRDTFFDDYLDRDPSDNQDVLASNIVDQRSRYVIARDYWEQQTMATNNLLTLVWFCKHWNASVITPYVRHSQFYGIWKPRNVYSAFQLDLLYDRSQFNSLLEGYQLPPLVPMETFLSKAKRGLIVLQLFYNGYTLGLYYPDVAARFNETYVFECSDKTFMKEMLDEFVKKLNSRTTNPFVVEACYCINASRAIHPNKFAEIIAIQGDSGASVVFNEWRGLSPSDAKKATDAGYKLNFRMFVPELKNVVFPNEHTVAFPYSSYVRGNASNFLRSLNVEAEFVAVHIRSEKLGIKERWVKGYTTQCWAEVTKILQEDILSEHPNITVLYFTDYGPLGSISCKSNCGGATITSEALAKNGLNVSRFDPAMFNAVSDSGFVALVEQCAVSMSKYVILAGGGSFQSQVRQQFLSQPTAKKGYKVCWENTITVGSFE